MDDSKRLSLDEIRAFLAGTEPVEFAGRSRAEVYGWVEGMLARHEYARQGNVGKGLRRYMEKMTGSSRVQVNLGTGVANGVLVVRTIADCAALLRRVLPGGMESSLEENAGMWRLREKISGCICRVVANGRKLNNCFWNFYLRKTWKLLALSTRTRLILNLPAEPERFQHRERADYDLDRFEKEFRERLYSDKGREILRAWEQREARPANGEER